MEIRLADSSDTKQLGEMRWDFQIEEPTETVSSGKNP